MLKHLNLRFSVESQLNRFVKCSAWKYQKIFFFLCCELGFALKGLSGSLLLVVVVSWLDGMLSSSSVLHRKSNSKRSSKKRSPKHGIGGC